LVYYSSKSDIDLDTAGENFFSGSSDTFAMANPRMSKGDINVNKVYLTNTIQSVESHNRREEESDCWRQQKLVKRVRDKLPSDSQREMKTTISASANAMIESDNAERALWAAKKARQMSAIETAESEGLLLCTSSVSRISADDSNDQDDRNPKSKSKKKKKRKEESKEKKKKKKKK
jgi:hypothetical protein